jgi:hypothetical protein
VSRPPIDILRLMHLTGHFSGPSWAAWRVVLKSIFALPLAAGELATFRALTGRTVAPAQPVSEIWAIASRRIGKTIIGGFLLVYLTCCRTYTLAPGERGVAMIICTDRRQSGVAKRYISGLLHSTPVLARLVARETRDAIELTNGLVIEIHTASFRSIRGYTVVAAVCDELAFWPTEEEHAAEPDTEILNALRPAMATVPDALLVCLSSPYAKRGELYRTYQAHYGRDDSDVLVVRAATHALNPTIPARVIERAFERDPVRARAEYGAEFRDDVGGLLDEDAIAACVEAGVRERAPDPDADVVAHFDASTGSGEDAAALAIAFRGERGHAALACVRQWRPPYSPSSVVAEAAALLRRNGVPDDALGIDRFAPGLVADLFREHGFLAAVAERDTSSAFVELLALINSQRVSLLDDPVLLGELRQLERRPGTSGRDSVSHPPRGHDDVAAAAAQALIEATRPPKVQAIAGVWGGARHETREVVGQQVGLHGEPGRLVYRDETIRLSEQRMHRRDE